MGHHYGAALPWWDLAFGTYVMPHRRTGRRPARYGVSEPLPRDLFGQLSQPCRGARRHLWLWRHPILAVRTLAVATRNLLVDIHRSARRPTQSVRRWSAPGVATTNASLVGARGGPEAGEATPAPKENAQWAGPEALILTHDVPLRLPVADTADAPAVRRTRPRRWSPRRGRLLP